MGALQKAIYRQKFRSFTEPYHDDWADKTSLKIVFRD